MPRPNQLVGFLVIWGIQVPELAEDLQDSLLLSPDASSLAGPWDDILLDDGDISGDLLSAPLDDLGDH